MKRESSLLLPALISAGLVAALVWLVHSGRIEMPDTPGWTARFRPGAGHVSKPSGRPAAASVPAAALPDMGPPSLGTASESYRSAAALAAFDAWTVRYLNTTNPAGRKRLEAEGLALAEKRREVLRRLIEDDPEAAVRAAVAPPVRSALPARIESRLERRVSGVGDYVAIAALPDDSGDPGFRASRRHAVIASRTYEAHVYGDWSTAGSRERVNLSGVAVDDHLALADAPIRPSEADEPIPAGSVDDGARPATEVVAGSNGADGPSVEAAAPAAPAAAPANTFTTGVKRLLVLRVRFADQGAGFEPQDDASMLATVAVADSFFRESSFGAMSLAATISPVYTLPETAAWYGSNDTSQYARNVLDAARVVAANPAAYPGNEALPAHAYTDFDFEVVRYTGGPGSFTGQGFVGARGCWLKTADGGVLAHELGHNLGLWHANAWKPADPQTVTGPGGNTDYGDSFDTMGSSSAGRWHFNAYEKNRLDWVPASRVETVSADGVYRLAAHDLGGLLDTHSPYALRFRRDGDRDTWLEFRQHPGWSSNRWILNGLGVRWDPWAGSKGGSQLLDTTGSSPGGRDDSAVAIGRTFSDPVAGVFVTPLRKAGTVPEALDVEIRFGTPAGNRAPAVAVTAARFDPAVGEPVSFAAVASDPDGDELSYSWDFGDPSPGAAGPEVAKAWNSPGDRRVRVVVSDRHGGTASASQVVRVGAGGGIRIAGRVLDLSGRPVADVRVHNSLPATHREYRDAFTDSDGTFVLTNVPPGPLYLAASRPGWALAHVGGLVPSAAAVETSHADFVGFEVGCVVSGSVRDAAGMPVAGALVGDGTRTEPTDADGVFTFVGSAPGRYSLTAAKAGYIFDAVEVLVSGDITDVSIVERTFTIAGEVQGLAAGAVATVTDGWHSTTTFVRHTPAGPVAAFNLPNVPAGRWHLRAIAAGATFSPSGFDNPIAIDGDRDDLAFAADEWPQAGIEGTVTDRGEGCASVTVSAGGKSTTTDSRGRYFLAGVPAGQHSLTASAPGLAFTPLERAVTVTAGVVTGQDFAATSSNTPPWFTQPAAAVGALDRPFVRLSARADDDEGAGLLRYSWSAIGTPPAAVTFLVSDSHAAADTVARFAAAGIYRLRATATDARGASAGSDVVVTVTQAPGRLVFGALPVEMIVGETWQFSVTCVDRFGLPMDPPASMTWSVTGGGTIDDTGWFTATEAAGDIAVTAGTGSVSAKGRFAVVQPIGPPRVVSAATANPRVVGASLSTVLRVGATSAAGDSNLTYTWTSAGVNPGPVAFLPNGTLAAAETTARFARSGRYLLRVVVRDSLGQSAESTVEVEVRETVASWRMRFFPFEQLDNPALERVVWGDEADPDGDGVANLLEYGFGLNPLQPAVDGLPRQLFVEVGGARYLAISFHCNPQASDLVFTPQVSSDLETWETGLVLVGEEDADPSVFRDFLPAAGQKQRFVRVNVTSP